MRPDAMRSRAVAAAIWIARAVGRLPGVDGVEVNVTVDPPWTPDRI
jgi:metal-sulfur cluster biosynthetic enzyme